MRVIAVKIEKRLNCSSLLDDDIFERQQDLIFFSGVISAFRENFVHRTLLRSVCLVRNRDWRADDLGIRIKIVSLNVVESQLLC